ncbi:Pelota-like protein, partial [Thalictrum thalictroides]
MKLIERNLVVDGAGTVTMVAQEPDDIWCLYGLISAGDTVVAETARKIHHPTRDGGKGSSVARVKVTLEIKVIGDPEYDKEGCCLRVRGRNTSSDAHVAT